MPYLYGNVIFICMFNILSKLNIKQFGKNKNSVKDS